MRSIQKEVSSPSGLRIASMLDTAKCVMDLFVGSDTSAKASVSFWRRSWNPNQIYFWVRVAQVSHLYSQLHSPSSYLKIIYRSPWYFLIRLRTIFYAKNNCWPASKMYWGAISKFSTLWLDMMGRITASGRSWLVESPSIFLRTVDYLILMTASLLELVVQRYLEIVLLPRLLTLDM